ncbi:chemotaxis protein CheW [Paludicola sp. MB14-C6]|uniref:chemotaxis protein CheW n=1 Tax=Paludihabitans sp. MB14-C6 TaxID=3070656 RepID=UPI0027DBC6D5|nr:chemotaxis protein CheW [Paludicola sp. MB14-C6]WMJ21906.1 chemotaxis protein CheW [Paludicola sp. MB14-C6]
MDMLQNVMSEESIEMDSIENTFLTFYAHKLKFGMPISNVIQIIEMQEITPVPEFPSYTKGVINLRGNIVSIVDLSLKLCNEETQYGEKTCIIITQINNILVGFIVDEVDEVKEIAAEDIVSPTELSAEVDNQYLIGITKTDSKVMLLIDIKSLLTER